MSKKPESSPVPDLQDRLAVAMEAAGHGVWRWNVLDGSAWYSETFLKLLGFHRKEFPERFESFSGHVHPNDIGRVHHALAMHLDGKKEFDLEFKMRTKEGTWRWVRARGRTIDLDGQTNIMTGTLTEWPLSAARDRLTASTSDQLIAALQDQNKTSRELEQARADLLVQNLALQAARASAEAATQLKSLFLANMSHEIRTPLNAILGFSGVLSDDNVDAQERAHAAGVIQRNSDHLLAIINDILDLSKIEAGGMGVEIIPCSPLKIIQDVVALMQHQARDKELELFLELGSPVPEMIETDPTRLRQILNNLIGNAIKFTQHGGVKVLVNMNKEEPMPRIDQEPSDAPVAAIRLGVQVLDTGIGIDDAQRNKLFHPFTQADISTTRRFGGTGLGLALSRRFSRALGGDITSSSEVGLGSVFTVEIGIGNVNLVNMVSVLQPQPENKLDSKATAITSNTQATTSTKEITVLVAEDGEDNQRLLVHHLSRAGIKVVVANNGKEAVELAIAAQLQSRAPEVILMDMQMPIMDGYEATAKLRERGWSGAIVAVTAHAMRGDRERCTQAGCDDYLTKPIDRDILIQTVRRFGQIAINKAL